MRPRHNGRDQDPDASLDLLAVRYVTGELSVREAETFEARLADEQEARESVARAVAVGMAVARQPRLETVRAGSSSVDAAPASPFGWRWLVAAVIVIGVGFAIYFDRDITSHESAPTANHEGLDYEAAEELIASWADFHDLPDAGGLVAENELDSVFANAGGSSELEGSLDFGAETPSWMVLVLAK